VACGFPDRALRLLDYGCGTGYGLSLLAEFGTVMGADLATASALEFRRPGPYPVLDAERDLGRYAGTFDVVTAFDVLEHLADDVVGLRRLRDLLAPGGQLVLTVPAYDLLWSGEDVISAHHRRYTRRLLERTCRAAGLEVLFVSYFNLALLPAIATMIWARRLVDRNWAARSNVEPVPAWLNRCLEAVSAFETRRVGDERLRLPAGASLVCRLRSAS
jgi:SAM-dependent methyltransferase